jgi:tetratricopeptide (TPR) repeat protein
MEHKKDGDYEAEIGSINKAMALRPDDTLFHVERAEAFINMCDFQSAILNYKKACLLDPTNDLHYSRLAFLYYFQGQTLFDQRLYPEALEAFSRAAEMRPDNVGYHIRRYNGIFTCHFVDELDDGCRVEPTIWQPYFKFKLLIFRSEDNIMTL